MTWSVLESRPGLPNGLSPWSYVPKILREHYLDMDWIESHEEEYRRATDEFADRMEKFGWDRDFSKYWINREMWYRKIVHPVYKIEALIRHYPKWARYWGEEEEETPTPKNFKGTTMVSASGSTSE